VRIASTRRVHFARNLLDQTDLPITKIADVPSQGAGRIDQSAEPGWVTMPISLLELSERQIVI
jgi:hypothetical protein